MRQLLERVLKDSFPKEELKVTITTSGYDDFRGMSVDIGYTNLIYIIGYDRNRDRFLIDTPLDYDCPLDEITFVRYQFIAEVAINFLKQGKEIVKDFDKFYVIDEDSNIKQLYRYPNQQLCTDLIGEYVLEEGVIKIKYDEEGVPLYYPQCQISARELFFQQELSKKRMKIIEYHQDALRIKIDNIRRNFS